jgi:hypothetical protein
MVDLMTERYGRATLIGILALVLCSWGCDRMWDWSLGPGSDLSEVIDSFARSNRMVVKGRDKIEKETTDPNKIAEVLEVFRRYPTGWLSFSGAGGEYDILLYHDRQLIGRLGLTATSTRHGTEDTLNVGDRYRRVPASEVNRLARKIGLPWPAGGQ